MYAIVLRRANGRYVKQLDLARSKYHAKQLIAHWEAKYDDTYQIVREPTNNVKGTKPCDPGHCRKSPSKRT